MITLDQQLYDVAKKLQFANPAELSDVVYRLGTFHIVMNYLKCVGAYLDESRAAAIWADSGVYGTTTADNIIKP